MTNSLKETDIDRQIVDIVQAHWTERHTPLLLSQLGSRISRDDAEKIKGEFENLASYLRHKLAEHVHILQSSENPTIIAAIPAEAREDESIDVNAMLSRTLRRPGSALPRFHPAFWAAFIKGLDPQTRRFISVGPPPRFQDVSGEETPIDSTEVTSEYIVGSDDDVAVVHRSIRKWLGDNHLDESPFLAEVASKRPQLPSDDLLGRLLLSLTSEELKRMSIPLDIVSKLRRQSV